MHFDIVIVGAGMAGASVAAELAGSGKAVLLLEAEDTPGYHTTGRSAAFWHESYGGPTVQPLITGSLDFLRAPDVDFSEQGFLLPRHAVTLGRDADMDALDRFRTDFAASGVEMVDLDRTALESIVPGLRAGWNHGIAEPSCADIDVAGLHAAYLRHARKNGVDIRTRARLQSVTRQSDGNWLLETAVGTVTAGMLVNAAGAWADEVARMAAVAPVNITPYRRTLLQVRVNAETPPELPLVIDVNGEFYFKGESNGKIWLSPHDEIPDEPRDVSPEELDIAIAIDRLEHVVDWPIAAVERKWAGLRTFAPDRLPVIGADPLVPNFFWLAGQGGYGIMTAPAIAAMAGRLLAEERDDALHATINADLDPALFSPDRFDL